MNTKSSFPNFFYNVEYIVVRPQTVQRDEIAAVLWSQNNAGIVIIPYYNNSRAIYGEMKILRKVYDNILKKLINQYRRGTALLDYDKIIKDLRNSSKELATSIHKSKTIQIAAFHRWYKFLEEEFYLPTIAPFPVEEDLYLRLKELLASEYKTKAEEYLKIITLPTRLNHYQKLRKKLLGLLLSGKNNSKNLSKLAKKYHWYNEYSFIEPLLTGDELQHEIRKISKKDAINDLAIINSISQNRKKLRYLLKNIKNKQLKVMARFVSDYVFIRTDRIEEFKMAQAKVRKFYIYVAGEMKKSRGLEWDLHHVANMSNEEILIFLKEGIAPDFTKIKNRESGYYVYYYKDGKANIIDDKIKVKLIEGIINKNSEAKSISGVTAQGGLFRGKVRIVKDRMDLQKFCKGEVMVSPTTMPDYTSIMKLAGAIVTDEGGVTSHAAIVSREFEIPCIVGTKVATRVLKDGDMVEVDADKGIVRIIK